MNFNNLNYSDFSNFNSKDIDEVINQIFPKNLDKKGIKFIITTMFYKNDLNKLKEANIDIDSKDLESYFENLKKASFFNQDGFPKLNIDSDNLLGELSFALYVAKGQIKGEYSEYNKYKFNFKPNDNQNLTELEETSNIENELFSYDWLKIMQDKKTGNVYLKKNDSGVVIPFLNKKDILLEYQYRPSIKKYSYEFPAFPIDNNDILGSMNKGLINETGFGTKNIKLLFSSYPSLGIYTAKHYYAVAKNVVQVEKTDDKIKTKVFNFDKIGYYIKTQEIFDSKTILGYIYFKTFKYF